MYHFKIIFFLAMVAIVTGSPIPEDEWDDDLQRVIANPHKIMKKDLQDRRSAPFRPAPRTCATIDDCEKKYANKINKKCKKIKTRPGRKNCRRTKNTLKDKLNTCKKAVSTYSRICYDIEGY